MSALIESIKENERIEVLYSESWRDCDDYQITQAFSVYYLNGKFYKESTTYVDYEDPDRVDTIDEHTEEITENDRIEYYIQKLEEVIREYKELENRTDLNEVHYVPNS